MMRHEAAKTADVLHGKFKIVLIGAMEIGLFRLNSGEWRAYRNFCPHMGAPVCTGPVSREAPQKLRCPWHAWDFDLATGELVGEADVRLESYQVEATDDTVFVWI